jgi:hypothetical protein
VKSAARFVAVAASGVASWRLNRLAVMLTTKAAQREYDLVQIGAYAFVESPVMFALVAPGSSVVKWLVLLVSTLLAGAATLALHRGIAAMLTGAIGRATGVGGGGRATASYFSMSGVQSLIVRERWDEAVAQLQAASRVHRGETGAIVSQQLGDLLSFRLQQHHDAVRSYRKSRELWSTLSDVRGREGRAYCTRRLIDLYADALDNPAAAAREAATLHA